jgi:hypothetical protein
VNGISSLGTSLVRSLTDSLISISVLLWFSLHLFYTSYPFLPPWISLTRFTSLCHLCARRFSKVKVEVASTWCLLCAQCSLVKRQQFNHTVVQPLNYALTTHLGRSQTGRRSRRFQGALVRFRHIVVAQLVYTRKGISPLAPMY